MLLVRLSAETACSPGKDFELFQSSEQREAALQPGHSSGHHGVGVCVCVSNPSVSYPPSTRSPDTTPIPSSPHLRIPLLPPPENSTRAAGQPGCFCSAGSNEMPGLGPRSSSPASISHRPQEVGTTTQQCTTAEQMHRDVGAGVSGGHPQHLAPKQECDSHAKQPLTWQFSVGRLSEAKILNIPQPLKSRAYGA